MGKVNKFIDRDPTLFCSNVNKKGLQCQAYRLKGISTCIQHTPKEFIPNLAQFARMDTFTMVKAALETANKLILGELVEEKATLVYGLLDMVLQALSIERDLRKDELRERREATELRLKILQMQQQDRSRRAVNKIKDKIA